MPETNASPTKQEVLLVRADLSDYLPDRRTIDSYIVQSLAECKRILEDERGTKWAQVFNTTDDAYFDNADATGRNEDRIKNAISNMAISMVFRDKAIREDLEESWTMMADYHEKVAKGRLLESTLDVDSDDSGTIEEGEEGQTGQVFLVK